MCEVERQDFNDRSNFLEQPHRYREDTKSYCYTDAYFDPEPQSIHALLVLFRYRFLNDDGNLREIAFNNIFFFQLGEHFVPCYRVVLIPKLIGKSAASCRAVDVAKIGIKLRISHKARFSHFVTEPFEVCRNERLLLIDGEEQAASDLAVIFGGEFQPPS